MARYCGMVGFSSSELVEAKPGVWEDVITEKKYFGDVVKDYRRNNENSGKVITDVTIKNSFSIVGDPFAFENLSFIKYIKYMGFAWAVESVEVQYPRLIISVGGRWNGPEPKQSNNVQPSSN